MRANWRCALLRRLASAGSPCHRTGPVHSSLFLRSSRSSDIRGTATSAAQPTSRRTVVSEDELVGLLIQGSNRPRAVNVTAAKTASKEDVAVATAMCADEEPCSTATAAIASSSQAESNRSAAQSDRPRAAASYTISVGDDGTATCPVTASRARHAEYEPFYRLRRAVQERPGGAVEAGAAAWMVESTMLEWMCCQCQSFNYVTRPTCRRCGATQADAYRDKFPPSRQVVTFPAVWFCEDCGNENRSDSGSRTDGKVNGKTGGTSTLLPSSLLTPSTASQTRLKFFCQRCGATFRGMREWFCPYCNHVNSLASMQCATCFTDRPANWACVLCGYTGNSVFRTTCLQCHRPRPRAWSDSTLLCSSCGQRNDVRWELCAICMSPLPEMRRLAGLGEQDTVRVRTVTVAHNAPAVAHATANEAKKLVASHEEIDKPPVDTVAVEAAGSPTMSTLVAAATTAEKDGAMTEGDGTWWCHHCNVMHRRNVTFCDICLRPRMLVAEEDTASEAAGASKPSWRETRGAYTDAVAAPAVHECHPPAATVTPPQALTAKPGEWQCPYCRRFNPVTTLSCCDKPREVPVGYWLCPQCCSTNHVRRRCCLGCGAAPSPQAWICPTCNNENSADDLLCATCVTPHPQLWRCAKCTATGHQLETRCGQCGAPKPTPPTPVRCAVCGAPNNAVRRACFRCRARLEHDAWQCRHCQTVCPDRVALRCPHCHRPREFDLTLETWICELCGTSTLSGGELAVRTHCPRCGMERSPHCLSFPTRWRCERCGIAVQTREPHCVECGAPRRVPGLHCSNVTCPTCFHETLLEVSERCGHCGASLSELLTQATSNVVGLPPVVNAERATLHTQGDGAENDHAAQTLPRVTCAAPTDVNLTNEPDQTCIGVALAEEAEAVVDAGVGVTEEDEVLLCDEDDVDDMVDAAEAEGDGGRVASWVCPTCSTVNRQEDEVCVLCTLPRVEEEDV